MKPRIPSRPLLSRKSTTLPAVALLSFAAVSAHGAIVFSDNFTNAVRVGSTGAWTGIDRDGGTSNDYAMAYNNTNLTVVRSDANAPYVAAGINGNSIAVTGNVAYSLSTYFTPTTILAGQSISLTFNIRTTAAPTVHTTASTFRFGLYDSNVGQLADNNVFTGAGAFTDDTGYAAFYLHSGATATTLNVVGERTTQTNVQITTPGNYTVASSASVVSAVAADTTYAVTLDIVRALDGNSITTTSSFNGITRSYVDTTSLITDFDHMAIFFGSQWGGTEYIDDVVVTFVPEPSAALLGGLGLLALLRRRR